MESLARSCRRWLNYWKVKGKFVDFKETTVGAVFSNTGKQRKNTALTVVRRQGKEARSSRQGEIILKLKIDFDNRSVNDILSFFKEKESEDLKKNLLLGILMNLPVDEISMLNNCLRIKLKLLPEITAKVRLKENKVIFYDYSYKKVLLFVTAVNKILGKKLKDLGITVSEKEITLDI